MSSPTSAEQYRFDLVERSAVDVLSALRSATVVAADPPWSSLAQRVPAPARLVAAGAMELRHLETLLDGEPDGEVVVGVGGGAALDTAKFLAWKTGKRLVQIPAITSVDAAFTPEVGVRVDRRVRYVGRVFPESVVLDIDLVRTAPAHLNRAGIGDILSCHTALFDWKLADEHGEGVAWDERLAAVGRRCLDDLVVAADDIRAVSPEGVRFLARSYRDLAAAITAAGHPRCEEGAEHFLAYTYEHLTGVHQVHGELVGLCVVAVATLQDNDPGLAAEVIRRAGARCHPADLGITADDFRRSVLGLPRYARDERLDFSIANVATVDEAVAERLWAAVKALPRESAA